MEYTQELENLKEEVNKSGKTIEGLTGLMQNFSGVASLQETLKKFQESNVLSRIETKVDILAQADYTGILSLIIDELNADLTEKYNILSEKIDNIKTCETEAEMPLKGENTEDIAEIKENISLLSQSYRQLMADLKNIKEFEPELPEFDEGEVDEKYQILSESFHRKLNLLEYRLDRQSSEELNEIEDIKGSVSSLNQHIEQLKSEIGEKVEDTNEFNKDNFYVIQDKVASIDEKVSHITDNLYPVYNLQTVSESLQAAQDKLNILIDGIDKNRIDQFKSDLHITFEENFNGAKDVFNSLINDNMQMSLDNFGDIRSNFSSLNQEIGQLKESIDNKVYTESLCQSQNLQTLNEQFLSAQDKLNILIDMAGSNSPENLKHTLDLENKFTDLNFKIDSQVIDVIQSVKNCINELHDKRHGFDEIKDAVSFLNQSMQVLGENLKYGTTNNISEDVLATLLNDINSIKASINTDVASVQLENIDEKITALETKISDLQEIDLFKEDINFIKNSLCQLEEKFKYSNEKFSDLANFASNDSENDIFFANEQLLSLQEVLSHRISHNAEVLNEFLGIFNSKIDALKEPENINQLKEGVHYLSESVKNSSEMLSGLCSDVHCVKDIQAKVENISEQMRFVSTGEEIAEINNKIELLTFEIRKYKENLAGESSDEVMNAILDNLCSLNEKIDFASENKTEEILNHVTIANEAIVDMKKEFSGLKEGIDGFEDDITDISSKINKLIIASDGNKELKTLSKKIDKINALSQKGLDSTDIVKEAILQMAGWIDSAGNLLEDNNKSIKKGLITKEKFESFEVRLESIEAKLEKLIDMELKEHNACQTGECA